MSDQGNPWCRISRGLYLLGFGTFLLLNTQDILPWSFWGQALAYWPVLLVAIGLRLLFERSSASWLVLLGPLLVLGTMTWVALHGPAPEEPAREWVQLKAGRPADVSAWTLEGRVALARLDVASKRLPNGVLLEGRSTESGRGSIRVAETAPAGRVRITNSWSERTFIVVPGVHRAACELGVTTALPVTVDFEMAFTTTRLDLPTSPVSRLAIEGAFNDLSLKLGRPHAEVHLDLEGAFNNVAIEVPDDTSVKVASDGLLNLVDERSHDRGPEGSEGYRLRIHGAFNRVVVRSG